MEPKIKSPFDFSEALVCLKSGHKVSRSGWNGKKMFLLLINSGDYSIPNKSIVSDAVLPLLPWIGMKTDDNCFVPWLASQTDILANDWDIVVNLMENY
jgi:hypothetical protein